MRFSTAVSFLICMLLLQCNKKMTTHLNFVVKDNDNKPVPGAEITINKRLIGISSKSGTFSKKISAAKGNSLFIEVSKKSSKYFYAPHTRRLYLKKNQEQYKINATLYYVPKSTDTASKTVFLEPPISTSKENIKKPTTEEPALVTNTIDDQDSIKATIINQDEPLEPLKAANTTQELAAATQHNTPPKKEQASTTPKISEPQDRKNKAFSFNIQQKAYGVLSALPEAQLYLDDELIGISDSSGKIIHPRFQINEFVEARFVNPSTSIEYTTDLILTAERKLQKTFYQSKPLKIHVLPWATINHKNNPKLKQLHYLLKQEIQANLAEFSQVSIALATTDNTSFSGQNLRHTLRKLSPASEHHHNLYMVPKLAETNPKQVELLLLNQSGKSLFAFRKTLTHLARKPFQSFLRKGLAKLNRKLPLSLAIGRIKGRKLIVPYGSKDYPELKTHQRFAIYGDEINGSGSKLTYKRIGIAKTTSVKPHQTILNFKTTSSRALVEAGLELVRLANEIQMVHNTKSKNYGFFIQDKQGKPISYANGFWNDEWIGVANNKGFLAPIRPLPLEGILEVSKSGFKSTILKKKPALRSKIAMTRQYALLAIDSNPSKAQVFINGEAIGKTPLNDSVRIPSGFTKLTLRASPNYKIYSEILDLSAGELKLTGDRAIDIEKALLQQAKASVNNRDSQTAEEVLLSIPNTHSDFPQGVNLLSQLYLQQNRLHDAKTILSKFLSQPTDSFQHMASRQIAQLDLGIVNYKLYARKPSQSTQLLESSLKHIQQASKALSRLSQKSYSDFLNNLYFYRALAQQALWRAKGRENSRQLVIRYWTDYIEEFQSSSQRKAYLSQAKVYLRQAEVTTLAGTKPSKPKNTL